ncbi:Zn(II)2Cys6 transcription factor domain-containing protein [Aspergillus melleus]|uniref:Zn(II)2Cys6 transcription factor domain-containing protein n=1 Tax=Aspergillus melleus TaxID=138277 RepID=UPI001E8DC426|nr:uncharacterized protein LDX57_007429 [Aspergillus melleus]KAH8429757.1 hypothetical protein LDX57_007429 [Aspergillus melleus]
MPRISTDSRSRQKSCVTCAHGKRRCNRQTPQCSRCLARGLECTYVNSYSRSTRQHQQQTTAQSPYFPPIESLSLSIDDILSAFPPEETTLFNDADLLASWLTLSPTLFAVPTLLPAGYFPEVAVIDRWSTKQLLRGLKSYPEMFARSRKTPFIHDRLYDVCLPDAMQDAFMVSASYYSRTPETEDTVLQILEARTQSLVRRSHQATLEELLATVQALMLLHIIQLFDGDVRQRAMAEQNMDTLRAWTMELQVRVGELGNPSTWREWIFAESVRRTVIVSVLIEGLYSMLKMGSCTIVRQLSVLPFTFGSLFWSINTDASWNAESHRLGSDTVLYGDFSRAFETGQVSGKLDAFDKFLLAPCIGERGREILKLED